MEINQESNSHFRRDGLMLFYTTALIITWEAKESLKVMYQSRKDS